MSVGSVGCVENGGKLYHTLKSTLNNNLIKIIQNYTVNVFKKELLLIEFTRSTNSIKYQLNGSGIWNGYNHFRINDERRWYLYTNE
jgi:hypothetical protein